MEARGPFTRYRLDSATKYHALLPALCESAGWHYLTAEPFKLNGVGLAGAMGWYDYSLRNRALDGLDQVGHKSGVGLRGVDVEVGSKGDGYHGSGGYELSSLYTAAEGHRQGPAAK